MLVGWVGTTGRPQQQWWWLRWQCRTVKVMVMMVIARRIVTAPWTVGTALVVTVCVSTWVMTVVMAAFSVFSKNRVGKINHWAASNQMHYSPIADNHIIYHFHFFTNLSTWSFLKCGEWRWPLSLWPHPQVDGRMMARGFSDDDAFMGGFSKSTCRTCLASGTSPPQWLHSGFDGREYSRSPGAMVTIIGMGLRFIFLSLDI